MRLFPRLFPFVLFLALFGVSGTAHSTPESPAFGVVVSLDPAHPEAVDPTLAAIREAGLQTIRIRPDWRLLQPEAGPPRWEWADTIMRSAGQNGLQVLFTLGYTPRWASRYPDSDEADVWGRNPPKSQASWEDFVRKASARYGEALTRWQIWEQPSLHHFRGSWKDMRDLAAATMRATRGRPRTVVLPESGCLNLSALDQTWRWGTDVYCDVLGLYPAFEKPEDMLRPLRTLKGMVERNGARKDLWISGIGWSVEAPPPPLRPAVVSEEDQARFLVRSVVLARAEGVRRIYWQGWQDVVQGPYQEQSRSGLVRADGSARPALGAYRQVVRHLGAMEPAGLACWGPHAYGALFRDGTRGVLAAWTDRDRIQVPGADGVEVEDLQGNPLPSSGTLELAESPVWVTGPWERLEALAATEPAQPLPSDPDYSKATEVTVQLGRQVRDDGLHVSRYRQVQAGTVQVRDGGWSTDLVHGHTGILFDVDDTFLYFVNGAWRVEVEVEVEGHDGSVRRGFNLQYDSMRGFASAPWQWIEPGPEPRSYRFTLEDVDFSDPWSDFRVNVTASPGDVTVRRVTVRRFPVEHAGLGTGGRGTMIVERRERPQSW